MICDEAFCLRALRYERMGKPMSIRAASANVRGCMLDSGSCDGGQASDECCTKFCSAKNGKVTRGRSEMCMEWRGQILGDDRSCDGTEVEDVRDKGFQHLSMR